MTVVYLDSVFVFNALLDYLLLLATARLAGLPLRRGRYALCGALGGGYAAAVFLPGLSFLAAAPGKAAAGLALAWLAFGRERHFLRLTLLALGVACAMAGSVLAVSLAAGSRLPSAAGVFYTDISARVLLISAVGVYAVFTGIFRAAAAHGLRGECLAVQLCVLGKTVRLTALRDTGNALRDGNGDPVLVAERDSLPMLPPDLMHLPAAEMLAPLRRRFPVLCPVLLPYQTAMGCDLLVSVKSDWAEIEGVRCPGVRVALISARLGSGYTALWGGEGRRGA